MPGVTLGCFHDPTSFSIERFQPRMLQAWRETSIVHQMLGPYWKLQHQLNSPNMSQPLIPGFPLSSVERANTVQDLRIKLYDLLQRISRSHITCFFFRIFSWPTISAKELWDLFRAKFDCMLYNGKVGEAQSDGFWRDVVWWVSVDFNSVSWQRASFMIIFGKLLPEKLSELISVMRYVLEWFAKSC